MKNKPIKFTPCNLPPPYNMEALVSLDLPEQICNRMNELGIPMCDDTMRVAERLMNGEGCMVVIDEEPTTPNGRKKLHLTFNPRP